jgi:hypothetical protein
MGPMSTPTATATSRRPRADGGGGESFQRVHWVAVPEAMRARRVNRRLRPPRQLLEGFAKSTKTVLEMVSTMDEQTELEKHDTVALTEATLDACLALLRAAGRSRWPEMADGLNTLLLGNQPLVVGAVAVRLHLVRRYDRLMSS